MPAHAHAKAMANLEDDRAERFRDPSSSQSIVFVCAREHKLLKSICWRGKGGGGGFVAHLLHLAAANTAPARPQRSKSTHPAKPASGRKE